MEYIKLEQFKSLEENVQKVFLEWWKPKRYDLYIDSNDLSQVECLDYIKEDEEGTLYNSMRDNMSFLEDMIPLLTERQVRRFVEDKTRCKVLEFKTDIDKGQYYMDSYKNCYSSSCEKRYKELGTDLFQAYWKVALEIAKEEIKP